MPLFWLILEGLNDVPEIMFYWFVVAQGTWYGCLAIFGKELKLAWDVIKKKVVKFKEGIDFNN